jgi:hypothetical protein
VCNDLTFPIYCFVARIGYLPSSVNHMVVFKEKMSKDYWTKQYDLQYHVLHF